MTTDRIIVNDRQLIIHGYLIALRVTDTYLTPDTGLGTDFTRLLGCIMILTENKEYV